MKGGCVAGLPVLCVVSPFRLLSGLVEWREWRVVVLPPCSYWVLPFTLFSPLLYCLSYLPLLLSTVCVPCHSIVGLVLCLCGRVVLLRNSGGGLCWVEGRVVSTVYTSSVLWCAFQWCVCCDGGV